MKTISIIGKKVPLVLAVIFALSLVGGVFAAVLVASIPTTITVNEAFSTTTTEITLTGYPGEEHCESVPVENIAHVDIDAQFSWREIENTNSVTYTTPLPLIVNIPAETTQETDVCFNFMNDSPTGDVTGFVDIERVA